MAGNRVKRLGADLVFGFENRVGRRVRFRGAREIGDRLGEIQLAFGEADQFASLGTRHRERQRRRVGVSYVLAGKNDQPTGQESNVLAAFEHFGQPVNRGVRVAALLMSAEIVS